MSLSFSSCALLFSFLAGLTMQNYLVIIPIGLVVFATFFAGMSLLLAERNGWGRPRRTDQLQSGGYRIEFACDRGMYTDIILFCSEYGTRLYVYCWSREIFYGSTWGGSKRVTNMEELVGRNVQIDERGNIFLNDP